MRKTLAGLLLTAGGVYASPALAVSPFDCPAIPGMIMGQLAGVCYFMAVNSDGSLNVTTVPSGTQDMNLSKVGGDAVSESGGVQDVGTQGVYNSAPPSPVSGVKVPIQLGANGETLVRPMTGSVVDADAQSNTAQAPSGESTSGATPNPVYRTRPFVYNGSTWDRAPGSTLGSYHIIRDAAGNARGAKVDASGNLNTSESNSGAILTALGNGIGTPGSSFPAQGVGQLGRAATTDPTAVTDGQAVAPQVTKTGRTVIAPYSIPELMVRGKGSATDTSATTIIASAGGSLKNYITGVQCYNTSATTITMNFSDSATTTIIVPASGGNNISYPTPLVTAAATAFTFTASTGVTTAGCSAQGYTGL